MNPDNRQNGPINQVFEPQNQNNQAGVYVDSVQPPNSVITPAYGSNLQSGSPQNPSQLPVNQSSPNMINNGQPKPNMSNKKKMLIVAVSGIVVLAVLTTIALLVAPKKKPATTQNDNKTQEVNTQKPADAIDVGNTNNSINQDISGLNNEEDFPATQLDDKSLNL